MMAVISIENFPDELYAKLDHRAQQNGRVISDEIIEAAQNLVGASGTSLSMAAKLALADRIRMSTPGAWIDDDLIRRARCEGRL
jgi:plasmid stability protein